MVERQLPVAPVQCTRPSPAARHLVPESRLSLACCCSDSRGGGGGRPAAPRTQSAPVAGALTGAAPTLQQQLPQQTGQGSKIIVSNLPTDVTEPQIRELFASTVGPVTKVALSFDARGASKGVAQVEFKKNEDATKAFQQYNKASSLYGQDAAFEPHPDPSLPLAASY